jgi:hypothetical protein
MRAAARCSRQRKLGSEFAAELRFHCPTAYDILRHGGVEVGKRDFMGTPVSS